MFNFFKFSTSAKDITIISLMFILQIINLPVYSQSKPLRENKLSVDKITTKDPEKKTDKSELFKIYGQLPINFESNYGQTDEQVKYLSRSKGFALFLTEDEAVFALQKSEKQRGVKKQINNQKLSIPVQKQDVLRMKFVNRDSLLRIVGEEEIQGKSNYLLGNDSTKWKKNIANFKRVKYENIYSNIDLVFYGNQEYLEYDFIVGPNASPDIISVKFDGISRLKIDSEGNLIIKTLNGQILHRKPVIYQEIEGKRRSVEGKFIIKGSDEFGFSIGNYDKNFPLVIDPVISYSSYLGGSLTDYGNDIAVDTVGNAYVTGETLSAAFPTNNAIKPILSGSNDAFVTKINPAGTGLVYSTYLGGSGLDVGKSIAVDTDGNVYIGGGTASTNFPVANAIQSSFGGGSNDGFISKLNTTGSAFVYSTYIGGAPNSGVGGTDNVNGIAVDASGSVYLTGYTSSSNFPLANPSQPAKGSRVDIFVTKINPAGNAYIFSTFLGGDADSETGYGIAADSMGNSYVTGYTGSTNFPVLAPLQGTRAGDVDAFVTKYNSSGGRVYSTYFGGSATDYSYSIAVDISGSVFIAGFTASSSNFPRQNAFQSAFGGGSSDGFVSKINAAGNGLLFSSFIGGSGSFDAALDVAVDSPGNVYITGQTNSSNFPLQNAIQTIQRGSYDAYITKINASGSNLSYSTYYGGNSNEYGAAIALNSCGEPYVIGTTTSSDFPATTDAFQTSSGGADDAFVTKIKDTKYAGVAPDATVSGAGEVGIGYYTMPATIDPEIMTDRKTQIEAQIYYPKSFADIRPLIIFLHGNHGTCGQVKTKGARFDEDNKFTIDGNCSVMFSEVESPSYKGYEYLATELAKDGYFVVSINANLGITAANDGDLPDIPFKDPYYIQARGKLVLKHLQRLYEWNTNGTPPDKIGTIGINLKNRIDFNNVGLMGHSRGGEGVRAAYKIYKDSSSTPSAEAPILDEIILDNNSPTGVETIGAWRPTNTDKGFYGTDYLTDDNSAHGTKSIKFTPTIPVSGPYNVYLRWSGIRGSMAPTRASNIPLEVMHAGGTSTGTVNMNESMGIGNLWRWRLLGTLNFTSGTSGSIKLSNTGTNGQVIGDSVRFVPYVPPPATPWKARIIGLNIKAIFEIGPTDFQSPSLLNPEGVTWNVLLPMCDRDVSRLSGVQVFDRAMLNSHTGSDDVTQKSTYTVWGTNHNFYNTQWQYDELRSTPPIRCIGPGNRSLFEDVVTPPDFTESFELRQTAVASLKAFFQANVGASANPAFNQNFNTRYELPPLVSGITQIDRGYAFTPDGSLTTRIDDFHKSGTAGVDGPGLGNTSNGITITYGKPSDAVPLHSSNLQSGKIEWTTATNNNYFQTNLSSPLNLTSFNTLDFRISRQSNSMLNVPGATNFTIQLVKNDGTLSEPVELCKYATLIGPVGSYYVDVSGLGILYKPILQTVRIPLSDFSVDLSQIKGVRFTFNITPKGAIWIANIRTSKMP